MFSKEQEELYNGTVNDKTKALKNDIAEVIIMLNHIEKSIKDFLLMYIKASNQEFVENVLLNNQIVSFSSKVKLLQYILGKEADRVKATTNTDLKEFFNALHTIMQKRNALAHSDSPLYTIKFDIEDGVNGDVPSIIKVEEIPGTANTIGKGSMEEKPYAEIIAEFNKYHVIAREGLADLMNFHYKNPKLK